VGPAFGIEESDRMAKQVLQETFPDRKVLYSEVLYCIVQCCAVQYRVVHFKVVENVLLRFSAGRSCLHRHGHLTKSRSGHAACFYKRAAAFDGGVFSQS